MMYKSIQISTQDPIQLTKIWLSRVKFVIEYHMSWVNGACCFETVLLDAEWVLSWV